MNHLEKHVIFYLGLAQLITGWAATVDPKTLTFSAAALSVSGLLTLMVKYVQANAAETPLDPTPPVKPAQLETTK